MLGNTTPEGGMNLKNGFVLILIASIISASFLTYVFTRNYPQENQEQQPAGFFYLQSPLSIDAFEIWQDGMQIKVNESITTYAIWYLITYNQTTQNVSISVYKSEIINKTTSEVYASQYTSVAIQWAMDNAKGTVIFHPATYIVPFTITIHSNTTVLGMGSTFILSEPETTHAIFLFDPNGQDITISGFNFKGWWQP